MKILNRLTLKSHGDLRQFAALKTPIWVFDVDAHCMWWANAAAVHFWKAPDLPSLLARDFSTDTDTARRRLRQVVDTASGSTPIQDTWTLYPGGTPIPALLSCQPVWLNDTSAGILIEVHRTHADVVDADTLRLMEAARATALAVATFSLDGQLLAQNPSSAAWHGPARARSGGRSDLEARFVDREIAHDLLDRIRADQSLSCEALVRRSDGLHWHLVSARRGRDPITGDYVAIVSEEDISEQYQQRQQQQRANQILEGTVAERTDRLRASEERYALATEMAAIWDWDVKSNKVFFSPSFIRDLGYKKQEFHDILREEGIDGLLFPDDAATFHAIVDQLVRTPDAPISEEVRFVMKDGNVRWFHAQGRMLCDDMGVPIRSVGLLTDVTRRRALETSLMAAQRLEAIGQLTGGIAHDFNNLLTVIQGNAQLLQEAGETDKELIEEIVTAVGRGADLTTHLLAFARRQMLKPTAHDLGKVLGGLQNTLRRLLTEYVTVKMELDADLWPVWVDASRLEAALLNVAINARDAMPNGGTLQICARNRVVAEDTPNLGMELEPGAYVEIAVTDTGRGMLPETLARAFEPFFSTKGVGRGSGLGLSMVLGFSRQSGGDACIDSQPNNGTRVVLMLPRSQTSPSATVSTTPGQIRRGSGEHIHVLEDNPSVQSALARMLTSIGYRVSTSTTVNGALQSTIAQDGPQLFLVDLILGAGQHGTDFLRALRATNAQTPVVLMSGLPETEMRVETTLADAYLTKPISTNHLAQAIATVLSREHQPG
ncbi:PAS domain S-box-containing protein [Sagittula marina]|uniref:histidine kinase n=1 Tax=Sagittula marina TaxID=943940 RepID=A0A7W6DP13_9RHOB|nr:PAS domain S-box-containing protein [Sagittula marina]